MPPAASLLGEDANYTLSIADRPSKSVILDAEDVENGASSVHLVLENIHSITPQKEERRPRLHRIAPVVGQISLYRPSAASGISLPAAVALFSPSEGGREGDLMVEGRENERVPPPGRRDAGLAGCEAFDLSAPNRFVFSADDERTNELSHSHRTSH